MSLTSYRAAPPRVELLSMGPRRSLPRTTIRGGGVTAARVRSRSPSLVTVMSLTRSHATRTGACDGLFARKPEVTRHCDRMRMFLLGRPGGDLLSRVLGRSTIGAEGFHGRVRDGIGCIAPRNDHQVIEEEDLNDARAFARADAGSRSRVIEIQ